jgi:serine/threonine-protein kinase
MLTGKAPRRADTVPEELLAAMTDPVPSLATVRGELPKSVIALVDRALAFEKTDRWPGARAMQDALILAREGISSTPEAVAEIVGGPFDPDSWDPGPTVQAIMPYGSVQPQPDMSPPPAPFGMNPLFVGAEPSMPPVARPMRPPMTSYAPPSPTGNLLAPLLVGGLLVLTVLLGLALLLVDREVFPRSGAATPAKTTAVAALPAPPPRIEDPIPEPPPALPDPPPPAPALADKPVAAPVVKAAPSASSASRPRRAAGAASTDPIVRTNPFDRRD